MTNTLPHKYGGQVPVRPLTQQLPAAARQAREAMRQGRAEAGARRALAAAAAAGGAFVAAILTLAECVPSGNAGLAAVCGGLAGLAGRYLVHLFR